MKNESISSNNELSDEDYNFTDTQASQQSIYMYPSILNKSSIHTYSQINKNLFEIPEIPKNSQKICLGKNMISTFPLGLFCLKEANLSGNLIDRIPEEINQIKSLLILRMNNNNVTILPYLKYVKHLQLYHNPIKVVTTKLDDTNLQYLVFDWVPFLMHPQKQRNQKQSLKRLCSLIKSLNLDPIEQFIELDRLFQITLAEYNYPISYYLHKAIYRKSQFFIKYLINYHGNLNYNAMKYLDRLILEEVLQENFQSAYELFTFKKSNFSDNQVFLQNIILTCKFHHMQLFSFLVNGIFKRACIIENQETIIDSILANFDKDHNSGEMLRKIMRYSTYTKQSPKKFILTQSYLPKQSQLIADSLIFILQNRQLSELFTFDKDNSDKSEEPLIHFAVTNRKPKLIKLLIEHEFSIFAIDRDKKKARGIRGSITCRKILWKKEKKILKDRICNMNQRDFRQQKTDKYDNNNSKWIESIFNEQKKQTPRKYSQKQTKFIQNLTSKQIQKIQNLPTKQVLQSSVIRIGSPKNKVSHVGLQNLFIPNNDQTGLVLQYWMYYSSHKRVRNRQSIKKKAEPQNIKQNTLILYEKFQDQFLSMSIADYSYQPEHKSFFSRLSLCAQTEDLEEQKSREYVIMLSHEHIYKQPVDLMK